MLYYRLVLIQKGGRGGGGGGGDIHHKHEFPPSKILEVSVDSKTRGSPLTHVCIYYTWGHDLPSQTEKYAIDHFLPSWKMVVNFPMCTELGIRIGLYVTIHFLLRRTDHLLAFSFKIMTSF